MVTLGTPGTGKLRYWIIARQHSGESMAEWFIEGLINTLLKSNNTEIETLFERVVFFVVPNMNPDGTFLGNLRTNKGGVDLNRSWKTPQKQLQYICPEVDAIRTYMATVGCDAFWDIHGDEARSKTFLQPASETEIEQKFIDLLAKKEPSVDPKLRYDYIKDSESLPLATNYVRDTFKCPAIVVEMPFRSPSSANKENKEATKKEEWSEKTAVQLGVATVLTLVTWTPLLSATPADLRSKRPPSAESHKCVLM